MAPLIANDKLILFQGDSVTDAGRDRTDDSNLGFGYPALVSAWFSASYPAINARFINRGISGDRTRDLLARWNVDCINLNPDWVSILVGINDTWRKFDSHDPTSAEGFESNYRSLLQKVSSQLNARIIILEPFLLPVPDDRKTWREDLDPKITIVRRMAQEFQATYIPLDGIFTKAAVQREASFWLPDGVHPSLAGHALIAQAWLKALQG